ncbi:MAG TPA: ATP-grasp domain-containing protein [Acetobacteraceae bacterium]|nr:ATP-grasp domain-containing protein [Acetobacteraceae bacterium]
MLLIEADGKALFAAHGIAVPEGRVVTAADIIAPPPETGPWMVKAQVPVGGRGRAGGIRQCGSAEDVAEAVRAMLGARLKGHAVEACLIEQVATGEERYLAIMVDPPNYGVRVIYLAEGGMEVERGEDGDRAGIACAPELDAIMATLDGLIARETEAVRTSVADLGRKLAELLLTRELALAEINPLFVSAAGCLAGDAKVVVDLNAVERQPEIGALIVAQPSIYLDANRKLQEGFDYVELDPGGEIGLVTTGAGLSMMLIDELTAQGMKPLNFCDVRSGQLRGSPQRLIRVLEWITSRPSLRVVLVNIFAGITDLGEFAGLLADAVTASPGLHVPVVARLVGRGAADARRILAEKRPDIAMEEDLQAALDRIKAVLA